MDVLLGVETSTESEFCLLVDGRQKRDGARGGGPRWGQPSRVGRSGHLEALQVPDLGADRVRDNHTRA